MAFRFIMFMPVSRLNVLPHLLLGIKLKLMTKHEVAKLVGISIERLRRLGKLPKFEVPRINIKCPGESVYGDYATGIALQIAKIVKMSRMTVARMIQAELEQANREVKSGAFEKIEIAEPGFINFFLSKEYLIKQLHKILRQKEKYGAIRKRKKKRIVIDYSSPNIAKPFGIGHLRSTIIGQALCNMYKFLGWKCISDNHLGDWGTQFGKLIYQIEEKKLKYKDRRKRKEILKNLTIRDLEELYVEFHKEIKAKPDIEEAARDWFKRLERGDKEAKDIWQACRNTSLKEFNRVYRLLGVKFDYTLGESFYQGKLKEIIDEARKKKLAVKSRGALIIKYPKDKLPPLILLKSDGATTYLTRDLATIKYRLEKWNPDLIVYEAGADQTLYFKQLFQSVELLGWANKKRFFHVAHGLIRWKHGKFSTRRGETIHLEEVLNEAIKMAENIIKKSETGRGLSEREKKEVAAAVGIGAIKYNDLSQHHSRDIVFDWNKVLNLKGNSGPYLQYTYARCCSVLERAGLGKNFQGELLFYGKNKKENFGGLGKEEVKILRMISRFPEVIEESAEKFSPNLICSFIFELAKEYNLFYSLYPIIKAGTSEEKFFRLSLTSAVKQTIKNALSLLSIAAPERM